MEIVDEKSTKDSRVWSAEEGKCVCLTLSWFRCREVLEPKHAKQNPQAHLRQLFPITCSCDAQWNLKAIIVKLFQIVSVKKKVKKSTRITSVAREGTIFPLMHRDKTNPQPQKSPSEEEKKPSHLSGGTVGLCKMQSFLAESKFCCCCCCPAISLYFSLSSTRLTQTVLVKGKQAGLTVCSCEWLIFTSQACCIVPSAQHSWVGTRLKSGSDALTANLGWCHPGDFCYTKKERESCWFKKKVSKINNIEKIIVTK